MGRLPVWSIQSLPAFWFEMLQSSFGSYFYSLSFSTSSRMGKVVKEGSTAATKSVAEAVAGVNANSFSLLSYSKSCTSLPSVINQWQCSPEPICLPPGYWPIYLSNSNRCVSWISCSKSRVGPWDFLSKTKI